MKSYVILTLLSLVAAKTGRCDHPTGTVDDDTWHSAHCCNLNSQGKWNGATGCYNIYEGEASGNAFVKCCRDRYQSNVRWW